MNGHSGQSANSSDPKIDLKDHLNGNLADRPARKLFKRLHRERFTGQLLLNHREKKKRIWFSAGEVVQIHSNLLPELFGQLMVARGWLNEGDLQRLLDEQSVSDHGVALKKRVGEFAQKNYGISAAEVNDLHRIQKLHAILQALTWDEGTYELQLGDVKTKEPPVLGYSEIVSSLEALLDTHSEHLGSLFRHLPPWHPKSAAVDLSEVPIWSLLAGCRMASINGVLSVRKQNKLYEIVIKFGVPLVFYEGTFGQPRQTILVRQASPEHERFFLDQIFKLFSFLKGSAHLRLLADPGASKEDSELQNPIREQTGVTRAVAASEIPFDLNSDFLIYQPGFLTRMKERLARKLRLK